MMRYKEVVSTALYSVMRFFLLDIYLFPTERNNTMSNPSPSTAYVLDTSTVIYDPNVFFKYDDCDFIIPDVVFRELDGIKTSNEHRGHQAREVFRILDTLLDKDQNSDNYSKGVSTGNGGKVFVELNHVSIGENLLVENVKINNNDDIIIVVTMNLNNTEDKHHVLMTQDVSMSIRAGMYGVETRRHYIDCEQFNLDSGVVYIDIEHNQYQYYMKRDNIKNEDPIGDLYDQKVIAISDYECIPHEDYDVNKGFVIRSGSNSVLGVSDGKGNIHLVGDYNMNFGWLKPRGAEQTIATNLMSGHVRSKYTDGNYKNCNGNEFICSLSGKAGSGKTTVALMNAIYGLDKGLYSKIVIFRPTVNMSVNSNLGFLPGTLDDKMEPWKGAIKDVLRTIGVCYGDDLSASSNGTMMFRTDLEDYISIEPINYLRGRTFRDTFVIVDEAQNLEPHELWTIVTRLGRGSSLVMTWDEAQVDNTFLKNTKAEAPLSILKHVMPNERVFHFNLPNNERGGMSALFT